MKHNPDIHHRQSIRLAGYDYAAPGAYFVTVCALNREFLFGHILAGDMVLNDAGRMVEKWWQGVPEHFPNVLLDAFVIMPNHFHGIVQIENVGAGSPCVIVNMENVGAGSPRPILGPGGEPPDRQPQGGVTPPLRATLGQIVGYFKYQTTKQINQLRDNPGVPVWQRNYYERVIRDDEELATIREYIRFNPVKWAEDAENPAVHP
ncbi:transposase [Geotalea uraniireducens]|uniref:Transposase IS200-like domain-containing protein n=1 Tax=Geotalea uraniireducens (strain Rf4) TaxID=351605 RepID=A5GBL6_GEOUR|nr:transposase [Geotalea uraniireducens]ABQ25033.1 hypothetical protein Gura_0825 [Geotalea uraniireducens Rf4]